MTTQTLADTLTEHRLIAALIGEPAVLAAADDVEAQDFSDPRCRHVLAAIRQLISDSADVDAFEVIDVLRLWDLERGTHVADFAGALFLAELFVTQAPYRGERVLWEHDMAWLRELASRRRALDSRAA